MTPHLQTPPAHDHAVDALDGLDLGVVWTDPDGRIVRANRLADAWLAHAAGGQALAGRSLLELVPGLDDASWAAVTRAEDAADEDDRRTDKSARADGGDRRGDDRPARPPSMRLRLPRAGGGAVDVEARVRRQALHEGARPSDGTHQVVVVLLPIAERIEDEAIDLLQRDVLEAVALGRPLAAVLDLLCRRVEALAPEVACSVLLLEDGRMKPVAGPSLPADYCQALDGAPIGPAAGSCGTAAWRREPVEVRDVMTDPLWADYRQLVAPTGLRACWSTPILSPTGEVMATFALYYRTPRTAAPFHRRMVDTCVPLCRVAIQHERARAQIDRLVYIDPLTGLPNRRLLTDRAGHALQFAARMDTPGALLLLDVDRFRTANDSLGHVVGDQLLQVIAQRLQAELGPEDTVARLGGDEFAVLVPDCLPLAARHLAETLRHALAAPVRLGGFDLSFGASIGISVFPDDGTVYEVVLKNAENAMYEAKRAGGNAVRFFAPAMNGAADDRLRMESALRAALARGQLQLCYQPKLRLDGTGCSGCEALVRWTDDALGPVRPDRFIALAEETSLVNVLDSWVLETACAQLAAWHAAGLPMPSVSVNVSPLRFQHDDVPLHVRQVLARTGLAPECLVLEITERVMMGDSPRLRDDLRALHDMGVKLSVDDFGTGYSSLGYLQRLPLSELKLDQSFVRGLEGSASDRALAGAVIGVGKALGLQVVAEGVETDGQRQLLVHMGCDVAQGFGYTAALPADQLGAWLTGPGRRWTGDNPAP